MTHPHSLLLLSAAVLVGSDFTCSAAEPATKAAVPKKENLAPGGKWKHGDMDRPRPINLTDPDSEGTPPPEKKQSWQGTSQSRRHSERSEAQ